MRNSVKGRSIVIVRTKHTITKQKTTDMNYADKLNALETKIANLKAELAKAEAEKAALVAAQPKLTRIQELGLKQSTSDKNYAFVCPAGTTGTLGFNCKNHYDRFANFVDVVAFRGQLYTAAQVATEVLPVLEAEKARKEAKKAAEKAIKEAKANTPAALVKKFVKAYKEFVTIELERDEAENDLDAYYQLKEYRGYTNTPKYKMIVKKANAEKAALDRAQRKLDNRTNIMETITAKATPEMKELIEAALSDYEYTFEA